jgi:hypothetical protein
MRVDHPRNDGDVRGRGVVLVARVDGPIVELVDTGERELRLWIRRVGEPAEAVLQSPRGAVTDGGVPEEAGVVRRIRIRNRLTPRDLYVQRVPDVVRQQARRTDVQRLAERHRVVVDVQDRSAHTADAGWIPVDPMPIVINAASPTIVGSRDLLLTSTPNDTTRASHD